MSSLRKSYQQNSQTHGFVLAITVFFGIYTFINGLSGKKIDSVFTHLRYLRHLRYVVPKLGYTCFLDNCN